MGEGQRDTPLVRMGMEVSGSRSRGQRTGIAAYALFSRVTTYPNSDTFESERVCY